MRTLALPLLLVLALRAIAQSPPKINPDGIVRADTTRPGLLSPGIVISIYGRGFGSSPTVLLDGKPLELLYAEDLLINARLPAGPPQQRVARITVVAGGQSSDPVEVRLLPETVKISLDGIARVDGPVWIRVAAPPSIRAYPPWSLPWDFACDAFEVRKDGKLRAPIPQPPPQLGMAYSGPPCPGFSYAGKPDAPTNSLPLHLQYKFDEPGTWEVRYAHYADFNRSQPGNLRFQSEWTPIEILPAAPRATPATRPQAPAEILTSFLPNLLAVTNDETLSVVLEYLYHPSAAVRTYAARALYYWPDALVSQRLFETMRVNGPAPTVVDRVRPHLAELARPALNYLHSDDPVLVDGAIALLREALSPTAPALEPRLRSDIERSLIQAADYVPARAGGQTANDFVVLLSDVRDEKVHAALWALADRHIAASQALIVIAWRQDPRDLPRFTEWLTSAPADDQSGHELSGIPYSMRNSFGEAALPWLRTALEKSPSAVVRVDCAQELLRANDAAGSAFASDAIAQNRPWKRQLVSMLNDQFPESRGVSDARMLQILAEHSPR